MFKKQIETYQLEMNNCFKNTNKKVGEEVILTKDNLIHDTRIGIKDLKLIRENGLIAPEFFKTINLNKKKPWVVEFWKVSDDIKLKDYLKEYCGCTIEVRDKNGSTIKNIISGFKDIEDNVKSFKDIAYRDYLIYQNMEQRFLPNDYTNNATMAFIIKASNENQKQLIQGNLLNRNGNIEILKKLFAPWFVEKYFENPKYDNNETDRGMAFLFGIPANMIEGILVNRNIEKDNVSLEKIKTIFPNCYICNIDGIVIK